MIFCILVQRDGSLGIGYCIFHRRLNQRGLGKCMKDIVWFLVFATVFIYDFIYFTFNRFIRNSAQSTFSIISLVSILTDGTRPFLDYFNVVFYAV